MSESKTFDDAKELGNVLDNEFSCDGYATENSSNGETSIESSTIKAKNEIDSANLQKLTFRKDKTSSISSKENQSISEKLSKSPAKSLNMLIFKRWKFFLLLFSISKIYFNVVCATILYGIVYLGALWDPTPKYKELKIAIQNNDSTPTNQNLGAKLIEIINQIPPQQQMMTFVADQNQDVLSKVDSGEYWGAIIIPANFTTNYQSGNMSVDYYYDESRQYSLSNLAKAYVTEIVIICGNAFANHTAATINTATTPSLLSFYLKPITIYEHNIHPIVVYGYNLSTYVASIVLWIIGVMIVLKVVNMFKNGSFTEKDYQTKYFSIMYISHLFSVILLCNLLSALSFFSVVTAFSNGTNFLYGGYNSFHVILFLWLASFSFTLFSMLLRLTVGYDKFAFASAVVLIFELVSSSAVLDPIVMPSPFIITHGLHLYYSVKGLRCLFFGSQCGSMNLYWGVLLAWAMGCGILSTLILLWKISKKNKAINN